MPCLVQVITTLELGGAQKIALQAAIHFQVQGYNSYLIFGEKGPLFDDAKKALGHRLIQASCLQRSISLSEDIAGLLQLRKIFERLHKKHDSFILHTHSSKAGVLGRLAITSKHAHRICHTVHGFSFPSFSPRRRWFPMALERLASHHTDDAIFVSTADHQTALRKKIFPKSKSHIIRAGADVSTLRKVAHLLEADSLFEKMGFKKDDRLLVTLANAKAQKDPLFHVDILASLHEHAQNYHLIFLGDGPLLEAMRAKAQRLQLTRFLHTPGFVNNVVPYLHMADAFLLASRFEGLPCSVLEALVIGLPTFVRDSGWAQDLTDWAETLFPLPINAHPDIFSTSIHQIVEGRPERIPSKLPNEFTLDGMYQQLSQVYSPIKDSLL